MNRSLTAVVDRDLNRKLVLLVGPRQAGKTTLARQLLDTNPGGQYLNYDSAADRRIVTAQSWSPSAPLVVFDELHKMKQWKAWLKGVYDVKPAAQRLLVTGSARLDFMRQSGDSLAGRFHSLRLHPLSVREWCDQTGASPDDALARLIERGGFPEPCLADEVTQADRWRLQYLDGLIREEVLEFSRIHELNTMRVLVDLLRERVGSPLSVASLARDLHAATNTVSRYLEILEALYIVFSIRPWHRNVARSLLRSPKFYFYDTGLVRGDEGARFENAVATMLLKDAHWRYDVLGEDTDLHYLRTRDETEIDFAVSRDGRLTQLIECKLNDTVAHPALIRFAAENPAANAVQLVRYGRHELKQRAVVIHSAARWLSGLCG